jgi:hypothetical protein
LPSLLYLGPARTARPLASWHALQSDTVNQLARPMQRRWRQHLVASWPRLTEPRRLVESWLREAGLTATGLEQIPHDLWPAQDLPSLDLLERLVVALAGFEMAPQVSADGSLQVVPLPAAVAVTRGYRLRADRMADVAVMQETFPELQLVRDGPVLRATGRIEEHRQLERWLHPGSTPSPQHSSWTDKRFSLTVQNQPIGAILTAVTQQLDVRVDWHPELHAVQHKQVSLAVENVTLGELLATVLQGQGATYRLHEGQLVIEPTPRP